jgi:hypothetical protein
VFSPSAPFAPIPVPLPLFFYFLFFSFSSHLISRFTKFISTHLQNHTQIHLHKIYLNSFTEPYTDSSHILIYAIHIHSHIRIVNSIIQLYTDSSRELHESKFSKNMNPRFTRARTIKKFTRTRTLTSTESRCEPRPDGRPAAPTAAPAARPARLEAEPGGRAPRAPTAPCPAACLPGEKNKREVRDELDRCERKRD